MKIFSQWALSFLFCITAAAAFADDAVQRIDPRDPTIWQQNDNAWDDAINGGYAVPCAVRSGEGCPVLDDEKSDVQRERERREHNRLYRYYEKHGELPSR